MKIIQSFWTKPSHGQQVDEDRVKGGWLAEQYHHYSMALSCCLLRQHYPTVELITDAAGAELLVEQLGLPYTSVKVGLGAVEGYPEGLWAASKLHAYSVQEAPFLHVDGDVFIWEPLPMPRQKKPFLFAQSPELHHHESYALPLQRLQHSLPHLPPCLRTTPETIAAINAGVLGGSDIEFLRQYAGQALDIINRNLVQLAHDPFAGTYNIILEQYLFAQLAREQGKHVDFLLPEVSLNFQEILQFDKVPFLSKYVHVLSTNKQLRYNCAQVEHRLRYHFPQQYQHIRAYHQRQGIAQAAGPAPEGHRTAPFYHIGIAQAPALTACFSRQRHAVTEKTDPFGQLPRSFELALASAPEVEFLADTVASMAAFGHEERHRVYDFLATANAGAVLDAAYQLAASACVVAVAPDTALHALCRAGLPATEQDDEFTAVVSRFEDGEAYFQPLVGWEQLLAYFDEEPLTGRALVALLHDDSRDDAHAVEVESTVFGFICYHLVHTGNLRLAQVPVPGHASAPAMQQEAATAIA